ncbi:MAG: hypothetical protein FWG73_05990 [Planctomycetaceae bacterium]|nr:hypothetical protein [Planctomycetaceae bacterium]
MCNIFKCTVAAALLVSMTAVCVTPALCQEQSISPEKAMMMGFVENYFHHNARDITMRKPLEWGDVQTDEEGNRTIRYKFEALIWDRERILFNMDMTFDKDNHFRNIRHMAGFPRPVQADPPDVTTLEGVQKLVEKFFSQNFFDITARQTVSWGELEKHDDGSVSLVYRYIATTHNSIVRRDERRFTFDKDGNVKSWERTEGFPQPVGNTAEAVTSLEGFLNIEGLKRYPVNKRIADFPADKIDLSSPEASYATQKNLIISNRADKFEQLSNMTRGRPQVPERERRGMSQEVSEEWAKTYREQFDVFEVFVVEDKYAFVFGLRHFDMLYDGNFFVKEGDEWLNTGNDQTLKVEEMAENVQQVLYRHAQDARAAASASNPI